MNRILCSCTSQLPQLYKIIAHDTIVLQGEWLDLRPYLHQLETQFQLSDSHKVITSFLNLLQVPQG